MSDPLRTLPIAFDRAERLAKLVGGAALALTLVFGLMNLDQLLRSYLFAFLFFNGLGLGCLSILLLQHLTGGLWGVTIRRLLEASRNVLIEWTQRLRDMAAGEFPAKVTAFRDTMAVHGRYRQPCPACGAPVQRIVYASNECNYCPRCQTGGKLLADRALSRLLKKDWPRTIDELEERRH